MGLASRLPRAMSAGGDEHIPGFGERHWRVRTQLPAEPRRLEPSEGRPVAHRGVGVDREVSCLDAATDADGAAHVARPDRAGQPELRVVGNSDRVRFVIEAHYGDDWPEDL